LNLTKIQWLTLAAIGGYLIYEFFFVSRWEKTLPENDPIIRGDLAFIYPLLLILISTSLVQFLRKRSNK